MTFLIIITIALATIHLLVLKSLISIIIIIIIHFINVYLDHLYYQITIIIIKSIDLQKKQLIYFFRSPIVIFNFIASFKNCC